MSYSSKLKKELCSVIPLARHCDIAEITALTMYIAKFELSEDKIKSIIFNTESHDIAIKYFTLLVKTFNIGNDIVVRKIDSFSKKVTYRLVLEDEGLIKQILLTCKFPEKFKDIRKEYNVGSSIVLRQSCCKRAFVRAAFLAIGSLSDPEKAYHFELNLGSEKEAEGLRKIIEALGIEIKFIIRKKNYVLYLKEAEQISEILRLMEAPLALMDFENTRIVKDVRNSVNRKLNCEVANLNKTVVASLKQVEGIELIREKLGLESLPQNLKEVAYLRLEYPEASLKELVERMDGKVGKSGLNHRLRKLLEIAQNLMPQST